MKSTITLGGEIFLIVAIIIVMLLMLFLRLDSMSRRLDKLKQTQQLRQEMSEKGLTAWDIFEAKQ